MPTRWPFTVPEQSHHSVGCPQVRFAVFEPELEVMTPPFFSVMAVVTHARQTPSPPGRRWRLPAGLVHGFNLIYGVGAADQTLTVALAPPA